MKTSLWIKDPIIGQKSTMNRAMEDNVLAGDYLLSRS